MNASPFRSALPAALLLALTTALAPRASAATWTPVAAPNLHVTSGAVTTLASGLLQTRSPEMRAVERDNGRHARWARLRFRYVQPSVGTSTLGSGAVRRQLGLKLQAADPCNLLYVMWWEHPAHQIAISVKRNPGQDTSAECGNRGYTDVAKIPLPVAPSVRDHRTHVLEARSHREADGTLALTVLADGVRVYRDHLGADLTAGLGGPIGVRSDNGTYRFRIFAGNRLPR